VREGSGQGIVGHDELKSLNARVELELDPTWRAPYYVFLLENNLECSGERVEAEREASTVRFRPIIHSGKPDRCRIHISVDTSPRQEPHLQAFGVIIATRFLGVISRIAPNR
jgi:hypothetical protein